MEFPITSVRSTEATEVMATVLQCAVCAAHDGSKIDWRVGTNDEKIESQWHGGRKIVKPEHHLRPKKSKARFVLILSQHQHQAASFVLNLSSPHDELLGQSTKIYLVSSSR
jgi:hypothetical protein